MVRSRKGGRPRKDGGREPNGRLLRYPSGDLKPRQDFGTDELRWRKGVAAGTESLVQVERLGYVAKHTQKREDTDLTPLGILVARGLITEHQHTAAVRFLFLHVQVFRDAPKRQGNGLFTRTPSGLGKDDAEHAVNRQQRAVVEWEAKRNRYNEIRKTLTLPQFETIRALIIDQEIGRQDTGVFTDIIRSNISGTGMLRNSGAKAPIAVSRRIEAIRNALDRLNGPQRRKWSELSDAQRQAISHDPSAGAPARSQP